MNVDVQTQISDNSDEILVLAGNAILRALERCGAQAEGYAKDLCPVDMGYLQNSITHKVVESEQAAYIGTNTDYAPYVELRTGKHYPGGRQTPWRYRDVRGNWHTTEGQEAQPFLKPAVADHGESYRRIIRDELENA